MTDILSFAAALRARKISSREMVEGALRQIARLNPKVNAFLTVTGPQARAQAGALDAELARGVDRGTLHGIPIAHKDLVRTKGVLTTGGSKIFAHYVPQRDARVAGKLAEAGAVSVGKTGLHELAYGITSNNPHYGAIRNPWDLERIPGGSSGGSAVAVATGMVLFAVGTDTGGSIRIPAAFCGIVGLKPTFGRVNLRGVLPLGFSQDHLGPMTRTVRDCAIAFHAMADDPADYVPPRGVDIRDVRIGVPRNYFFDRLEAPVREAVNQAIGTAAEAGARMVEIDLPDMEAVRQAASTCLLVEAALALKPWAGRRADLGADIQGYLDQGFAIPAVDYLEAMRTRRRIGREFQKVWTEVDCIFTPATPMTAPRIGQAKVRIGGQEEDVRAAATRFTRPFNALGIPAISLPCGFVKGLPVGLQIVGPAQSENFLFRVAAAMEDALGVAARTPELK